MRVESRPLAEVDLVEIVAYIAAENPPAAYRVFERIKDQTALLADYPELGRPGRVKGTRELVVSGTRYIEAYRVMADFVTVPRVLHGARRWPKHP